jgi:hypothetical protein
MDWLTQPNGFALPSSLLSLACGLSFPKEEKESECSATPTRSPSPSPLVRRGLCSLRLAPHPIHPPSRRRRRLPRRSLQPQPTSDPSPCRVETGAGKTFPPLPPPHPPPRSILRQHLAVLASASLCCLPELALISWCTAAGGRMNPGGRAL